MVSYVDETTKNVTNTLRSAGMWDNTLFVWTTDNGSPVSEGGSNHPLKGGKGTTDNSVVPPPHPPPIHSVSFC